MQADTPPAAEAPAPPQEPAPRGRRSPATVRARLAGHLTEAQFLEQVRQIAQLTGWFTYHTHDSRNSERGFPDLVLVNPLQRRIIYAELKTETGAVSPAQVEWLTALAACGAEAALWRPADIPRITRIMRGERIGAEQ
jgi:hypothetical protein